MDSPGLKNLGKDSSPSRSTGKSTPHPSSPRKCQKCNPFSAINFTFLCNTESWAEFDWCKYLCKHLKNNQLKLSLPQMFIFSKTDRSYFAFGTNEERQAHVVQGMEAWGMFFNSFSTSVHPIKFLAIDKSGSHTISHPHSAHEYATQILDSFILLVLDFELKSKASVRWTNKSGGCLEYENDQIRRTDSQLMTHSSSSSQFQHDIEKFKYAGRLKKSSFSPLLPHHSVLAGQLAHQTRGVSRGRKKSGYPQLGLEGLISAVLVFMQKEYNSLGSMTLHVLETNDNCWLLCNITSVQWIASHSPLSHRLLPPILQGSLSEEKVIPKTTQGKLCTNSYRESALAKSLKRPPYIDLREVHSKNIQLYETISNWRTGKGECFSAILPTTKTLWDVGDIDSSEIQVMNHVTKMFDKQSSEMRVQKAVLESDRKVQLSAISQPGRLKKICVKVYMVCSRDEALDKFFPFTNHDAVLHLSEKFEHAITSSHNYYLSKRVHEAHKGMNICESEFTHFMDRFTLVMREEGTGEEEVNLVLQQMYRYKDDIIGKL